MTTTVINLRGRDHAAARSDPGVVYVGRANPRCGFPASVWANPYRAGMSWERACRVGGGPVVPGPYEVLGPAQAVTLFLYWLMDQEPLLASLGDLREKVLACWCCDWGGEGEPSAPCHAVVLARLAESADVFARGHSADELKA